MNQIPGLYVSEVAGSGRGVFTASEISEGSLIEVCPVIVIPKAELPIIHKTILQDYYFQWGEEMEDCAIALGFGSLYNNQIHSNATFILDIESLSIDIVATADIKAGAEIYINYNGESGDESPLWFGFE